MLNFIHRIQISVHFFLIIFSISSGSAWAFHGEHANQYNVDDSNIAISGYDTVAYFLDAEAKPGNPNVTYEWNNAVWQFSSAKNRARFVANPEKYAPQYGSFCALGVTFEKAVSVDPKAWTIVDGKLYLNYNLEFREKWRSSKIDNIEKANTIWTSHRK